MGWFENVLFFFDELIFKFMFLGLENIVFCWYFLKSNNDLKNNDGIIFFWMVNGGFLFLKKINNVVIYLL